MADRTSGCAVMGLTLLMLIAGNVRANAADGLADLHLETHGFVSFGYLKSWGNNWHGDTLEGTSEFWEAGANVIARPMDRLRLGAQLFVRDLGIYGNGQVELDWAYADWRAHDALGVQVGRVKMPLALYSEAAYIDAGRVPIFLPRYVYSTRARDALISTDGGKLYGSLGPCDWAAYAGNKHFTTTSDFANYLVYANHLGQVDSITSEYVAGGMLHWRTPLAGLETQISGLRLQGLEVQATSPNNAATVGISTPEWYIGCASLLYDRSAFTWTAEYVRYYAPRHTSITPVGGGSTLMVDSVLRDEAACLTQIWHALPWLDVYTSLEAAYSDPADRRGAPYMQNASVAVAVMPTEHWVIKLQYLHMDGTKDLDPSLNPVNPDPHTRILALKTTVDF